MNDKEQEFLTVGQIADKLGEPPSRVQYIIAKHRLKPARRVGIFRLFGASQITAIEQGLYGMQIRGNK